MPAREPSLQVVLKVASRCNLNCGYCYVYHKGDASWREKPAFMSDEVFDATLDRTRRHCLLSHQRSVTLTFHGGEPCLLGPDRFDAWCRRAIAVLGKVTRVRLCLQTNGTLLDDGWASLLKTHRFDVAVSLDGPQAINDSARVDHANRGSYGAVVRGIRCLQRAGIPVQILSVIQFGADGVAIHRHFAELGAQTINYLFPDYTHDTIGDVRRSYGPTPCADYLIPIFEHWWSQETTSVRIVLFWNIARLVLGGESEIDLFGNRPFGFLFVEADGTIEGLDVLRICQSGMTKTKLNVLRNDFLGLRDVSPLHDAAILRGVPLPGACEGCPEQLTCAGGYLPHRFSLARGFDNPTIWCADTLRLFEHIRQRLEVFPDETRLRRQVLEEIAGQQVQHAN